MKLVIDMYDDYYNALKSIPDMQCTGDMLIIKSGIPLNNILNDISTEIENYDEFILCANGQKGIHIDSALEIINNIGAMYDSIRTY